MYGEHIVPVYPTGGTFRTGMDVVILPGVDHREWTRSACEAWLVDYLVPLARSTADAPIGPIAELAAALREHPEVRALRDTPWERWYAYQTEGAQIAEDLKIVTIATMVAHWSGDTPTAIDCRDMIACSAYLDTMQYARWRDLLGFPPTDEVDRAVAGLGRWTDLDAQVSEAFLTWLTTVAAELPTPVSGIPVESTEHNDAPGC